jgi:predicted RND superfamily exporter protein
LHFDPENELTTWQKMQMVGSIEKAIKQTTAVNATLSVATFEPYVPRGKRFVEKFERKSKLEKWNRDFHKFEDAKLVHVGGDESYWRISLRVAALNDIDYGDFLETVDLNVNNQLAHLDQHGVDAWLTGGIPLVYKAQHQILRDLMYSFLTAFLIITVILMFVLGSIRAGLVAMIPNVFPPLVVFGAMGWLGYSIEIGSVMTASVALGIAVDDTLHFLTWYRRGTTEGLSRYASIRYAFDHCAKAMIDTSLICGLGVLPFVFGVFMPTVKFALLLMIMLFTALLGDLVLLPAILAGPAGLLFRLKKKKKDELKANQPPTPLAPHISTDPAKAQLDELLKSVRRP